MPALFRLDRAISCLGYNKGVNDPLARRIAEWIDADPAPDDDAFNALALGLFARQYALNAPYRRLCDSDGKTPQTVTRWQDIPAAPAQAFKAFALSCAHADQIAAVFHSSGTTGAQTSRHYMDADALELYEISLRRGFGLALSKRPKRLVALMPPPSQSPHSSLSHMLGTLGAEQYFWDDDARLARYLQDVSVPVTLFGTAFAFVQLFDGTGENWRLPPGSVVVETGGFKGRTREVSREELYGLFKTRLGVPLDYCFSEYGMSEMASQFYGQGLDPEKRGPRWVRTRAIDPLTGDDASDGAAGLLRHYDLANFNSVLALQTQDWGTLTPQGFILHGRASEAELRGCSLTVEELWESKSAIL